MYASISCQDPFIYVYIFIIGEPLFSYDQQCALKSSFIIVGYLVTMKSPYHILRKGF